MKIDSKYPGTGIIEKFLSELVSKDYKIKVTIRKKQILKTLSLLFLLKKRRAKVFPQLLSLIGLIIDKFDKDKNLKDTIMNDINGMFKNNADYLYDDLWIFYFLKSQGSDVANAPSLENNPLFQSIRTNEQKLFNSDTDISLFKPIEEPGRNILLAQHLNVFAKNDT